MPPSKSIVWFRNDLRLHDHEPLREAGSKACDVLSVYVLDDRHFGKTLRYGFPKTGAHRARFLLETLADLRAQCRELGGELIVRRGLPEEVIPTLAVEFGAQAIFASQEATSEEVAVEVALRRNLAATDRTLNLYWGATLFHPSDLPFKSIAELPEVFTEFRKAVEKRSRIRAMIAAPLNLTKPSIEPGTIPTMEELGLPKTASDSRAVLPFAGGETGGMARLRHYIWTADCLKNYKETRNGMLGADYSSKFSAWLALGCLSPRFIWSEVQRYERERVSNQSTYWLVFELLWRDYFRFIARKHGRAIFLKGGIQGRRWAGSFAAETFQRWKDGTTGWPMVDANMRELAATGFMSNRGRQNVASFLVRDMGIDWRAGAEWFESQLVDHDPASNYGNWNYAAGIGNDPREDRYFDVVKQARQYDPAGEYLRHWMPELSGLQTAVIHAPRPGSFTSKFVRK